MESGEAKRLKQLEEQNRKLNLAKKDGIAQVPSLSIVMMKSSTKKMPNASDNMRMLCRKRSYCTDQNDAGMS